jgi:hypothetical protein
MEKKKNTMKQLVAVKTRNEKHWTRIGVAYENHDGSWNLRFDYLPADLANTTIQLRDFRRDGGNGIDDEAERQGISAQPF